MKDAANIMEVQMRLLKNFGFACYGGEHFCIQTCVMKYYTMAAGTSSKGGGKTYTKLGSKVFHISFIKNL